jgi:polyferredoxin
MGKISKRFFIQIFFFFLQNPFIKNFFTGKIYQGKVKMLCTPGLNCYSCPAAAVSCPVGAVQLFFSGAKHSVSFFVTGFLLVTGVVFGRFICGYVCPFGLLQDLTYKIKSPKFRVKLRFLRYVKYFVLLFFVIVLPIVITHELSGLGSPWFCKYICPSGTIFGAVPLLMVNGFLRGFIGLQFFIKMSIAVGIVLLSIFIFRIFCRVLCPLGAFYALFNKIAIIKMHRSPITCKSCNKCAEACPMMLDPARTPDSPECIRCGECVGLCC